MEDLRVLVFAEPGFDLLFYFCDLLMQVQNSAYESGN